MNSEAWHKMMDRAVRLAEGIQRTPARDQPSAHGARELAALVIALAESYGCHAPSAVGQAPEAAAARDPQDASGPTS